MHRTNPSVPAHRPWLALLLLALAACATAPKKQVLYPPPPDKPRVAWVRSFTSEEELRNGFFQRVWQALVPHDSSTVLLSPTGIALSPDERKIYVSSSLRGRIVVVDRESGKFDHFGSTGETPLKYPIGIALDAEGNVYVSDKTLGAVCVFDGKRKLVRFVGKGVLANPSSLALDRKRQLLYVISDASTVEGRHVIQVFSFAGKHLRTIGGPRSTDAGKFNFPTDLAVSPRGELFVADMLNFRVQVFDLQGQLVRMFGEPGTSTGLFDKIHGIGFDTLGNTYVVDTMIGVQIFNDLSQPLMSFGQGILNIPLSVVVDSKNHIFVTDYAHRVHEFELINTKASDSYLPPPGKTPASTPATAPSSGTPQQSTQAGGR